MKATVVNDSVNDSENDAADTTLAIQATTDTDGALSCFAAVSLAGVSRTDQTTADTLEKWLAPGTRAPSAAASVRPSSVARNPDMPTFGDGKRRRIAEADQWAG